MKKLGFLFAGGALALATPAMAANVIDQNQPNGPVYMAAFSQTDLAQSFQQAATNISGAGIFLQSGVGSGLSNITISLWNNLPNISGATMLATGTAQTESNDRWLDVFWSPVTLTAGQTYFLVFQDDRNAYGIAGDTNNPYANGNVYANSGFGNFSGFDYAFRTYADDATGAVPEPATWAMMIMGFGLVGGAMRRRQNVRVSFA